MSTDADWLKDIEERQLDDFNGLDIIGDGELGFAEVERFTSRDQAMWIEDLLGHYGLFARVFDDGPKTWALGIIVDERRLPQRWLRAKLTAPLTGPDERYGYIIKSMVDSLYRCGLRKRPEAIIVPVYPPSEQEQAKDDDD